MDRARVRSGLTALTGETGAGKSIVVDALALAVGGRADAAMPFGTEQSALEVSATFDLRAYPKLARRLEAQAIEGEGESFCDACCRVMVARVLSSTVSRYRYKPCAELGELLVDIHGQQEFLALVRRRRATLARSMRTVATKRWWTR